MSLLQDEVPKNVRKLLASHAKCHLFRHLQHFNYDIRILGLFLGNENTKRYIYDGCHLPYDKATPWQSRARPTGRQCHLCRCSYPRVIQHKSERRSRGCKGLPIRRPRIEPESYTRSSLHVQDPSSRSNSEHALPEAEMKAKGKVGA